MIVLYDKIQSSILHNVLLHPLLVKMLRQFRGIPIFIISWNAKECGILSSNEIIQEIINTVLRAMSVYSREVTAMILFKLSNKCDLRKHKNLKNKTII